MAIFLNAKNIKGKKMNNRFRFRVWFTPNYQEPEMIYDAEQTYDFGCQSKGSYYHNNFSEILEDKDCIVMQCTGLKDKNDKLIYEGDIIKVTPNRFFDPYSDTFFVKYNLCGFYLATPYKKMSGDWESTDTIGAYNSKIYEVIGNIYENPELLEENND
jgi:uncharacterized phage protein (TIGR01671 family)